MLQFINGSLLDADTNIIAHQVNCQGVMGAGLAKQIRNKYPQVYTKYHTACNTISDLSLLGKVQVISTDQYRVANLFGQRYYGHDKRYTDYDALTTALTKLRNYMSEHDLQTLGLPYGLGCGLAGGDWKIVYEIIRDVFTPSDILVKIYQYK